MTSSSSEDLVLRDADHQLDQRLRHAVERHDAAEHYRRRHDDQRRCGDPRGGLERIDELRERERPIEEHAGGDRVEHRHRAGFGRREDARHHAAEEQHRDDEHRRGDPGAAGERGEPLEAVDRPVAAQARGEVREHHQADPHQDARQDAADQQPADRDPELRADDHQRDRRRNDRADHRRRRDDRAGELARIFLPDHARDHDRRDRRGVGQGRAGDPGQQHAGGHGHVREAAADPADEPSAELDQLVGQLAAVEQLAREHEGRQREQREGIDRAVHLARQHGGRDPRAREQQKDRAGERQAERDRHAEREEHEERQEEPGRDEVHGGAPSFPARRSARPPPRCRSRPGRGPRNSRNTRARRGATAGRPRARSATRTASSTPRRSAPRA